MTARSLIAWLAQQEELNFLLTNRIPRRSLTRFMGWFSKIEQPIVCRASIAVWHLFADVDLSEARDTRFSSLHDCFTRRLKDGARAIDQDPAVLVSPCDAIVGASGKVDGVELIQAKGRGYTLEELLRDRELASSYRNGCYVTLRLTSGMYHHFHAPHDCRVVQVTHIPGDTWNVNPIALSRIDKVFCKNERAVILTRLAGGQPVTLVPVAAILVAGIRLDFVDLQARAADGEQRVFACDATLGKGEEMGWFEHGSTLLVLAPDGFVVCDSVRIGSIIRVGEPLMRLP